MLKNELEELYKKRNEYSNSLEKSKRLFENFKSTNWREYSKIIDNEKLEREKRSSEQRKEYFEKEKERLLERKENLKGIDKYSEEYLMLINRIEEVDKQITKIKEDLDFLSRREKYMVDENVYEKYKTLKESVEINKQKFYETDSIIREKYGDIKDLDWEVTKNKSKSEEIQKRIDELEKEKGN